MFAVSDTDVIAIQRAHAQQGQPGALAEIRRRWPALSDHVLAEVGPS